MFHHQHRFADSTSQGRTGRRRGRLAKACSECHARKQKCDGSHPCQNCTLRKVPHLCVLRSQLSSVSSPRRSGDHHRRPTQEKQVTTDSSQCHEIPSHSDAPPEKPLPQVGHLWKSRGAPAFFGNSYFGPQVSAAMIDSSAPYIQPGVNTSRRSTNAKPFRDESGPFAQLWDLLGCLPRQKETVDRLVDHFLTKISPLIDAVHPRSFEQEYDRFWGQKRGFDDVTTVDIRWLALLFIILAFGAFLDCPDGAAPEIQREFEETSLKFFWACRRAIVIAPSFYGESTDLVRAGLLVTRYCLFSQRITESWLTVGFAARLGMAQGFHIDGTNWQLPRRVTESRRRLWCHLYLLDRMISLALGRPYCILDGQSLAKEPENIVLDDLPDQEAASVEALPLMDEPTQAVLAIFSYRLAKAIGQVQEQHVGIRSGSYRDVLRLDAQLLSWKNSLPAYLSLDSPDLSLDEAHPYLAWNRLYLHTGFHFARMTLHRPYILRSSVTDQHRFSREACFSSACADLKVRLEHDDNCEGAEHYNWCLNTPQFFNSAIVLGILALQEQSWGARDLNPIINDLQAFCDKQNQEIWINEFGLAEVKVVEMVIEKLSQRLRGRVPRSDMAPMVANANNAGEELEPQDIPQGIQGLPLSNPQSLSAPIDANNERQQPEQVPVIAPWNIDPLWGPGQSEGGLNFGQSQQFSGAFSFPGPTDLVTWQGVINALGPQIEGSVTP